MAESFPPVLPDGIHIFIPENQFGKILDNQHVVNVG
jgi:hypothetical protein